MRMVIPTGFCAQTGRGARIARGGDAATPATPTLLGEVAPENVDWLAEDSCFTMQCTRCQRILESDCGEAHFPSVRAAAEAALSARWLVSAHRVWCRSCTALVAAAEQCPTDSAECVVASTTTPSESRYQS
jgi:hypothetical protein